jgi:hypothetical protein
LKNALLAIKRKYFVKKNRDCREICDSARRARFYALIQKLAFALRACSVATPAKTHPQPVKQRIVRSCA